MFRSFYIVQNGDDISDFMYAGVDENGYIVKEPWDHGLRRRISDTLGILVHSQAGDLAPHKELELYGAFLFDVYATDSRIVFSCKEYDTGSTYWGLGAGAVAALIMTAVSKSNAKKRTEDTTLVGQIRYEWLSMIEFHIKNSKSDTNTITFYYSDSEDIIWYTSFALPDSVDAAHIAGQIAYKACRYKLAMKDEKTEEERALLYSYCQGKRFPIESGPGSYMTDELIAYTAPFGEEYRPTPEEFDRFCNPPSPTAKIAETESKTQRVCAKCGEDLKDLPSNAKFCPKCGTKVGD